MAISSVILVVVGTLSGLVPALKASRLDPVEALRCGYVSALAAVKGPASRRRPGAP